MSVPLSVATNGYLTGVARDIVAIATDGLLISVVASGSANKKPYFDPYWMELVHRDDEEFLFATAIWFMEMIHGNSRKLHEETQKHS
jgi:hypothetical protein